MFVYQRDPRHSQESHICLHNEVRVLSNILLSFIRIHFIPIISDVCKDLTSLRMKIQVKDGFMYILNISMRPHFNSVDLQIYN